MLEREAFSEAEVSNAWLSVRTVANSRATAMVVWMVDGGHRGDARHQACVSALETETITQ